MEKKFNVTGLCNPQRHYMVDINHALSRAVELIGEGEYFAVNRPRQFGKTTLLTALAQRLWRRPDQYVLARLSFEGVGDDFFQDETTFCPGFVGLMAAALERVYPVEAAAARQLGAAVCGLKTLSVFITSFVEKAARPVVVLIDEVDKASNNQLFLSFLGVLRNKYLDREAGEDDTFQSVVLAGVHDVKSLKLKIRPEGEAKLNSPWNIAADFDVDMSFNPAAIRTMLEPYAADKGVSMDFAAVSERIHYYSDGHPFLVSKLCKCVDEEEAALNPAFDPGRWTAADIDWAFQRITRPAYQTTNFDDLIKNLENNQALYDTVYQVAINGAKIPFSPDAPAILLGKQFGILADNSGVCAIHNRVYEQRLYNYFVAKDLTEGRFFTEDQAPINYQDDDGHLDLRLVLEAFQRFMREHCSRKDVKFLEREGRLLFMSFLKPIINGEGFDFKEPVVGDERRTDLVIVFHGQRHVVELKRWGGERAHAQGLRQLSDYLDLYGLKSGFLLIFDFNKGKTYKSEQIRFQDKDLFAVWV